MYTASDMSWNGSVDLHTAISYVGDGHRHIVWGARQSKHELISKVSSVKHAI